jgi:endo-1,4-beta-xylanase
MGAGFKNSLVIYPQKHNMSLRPVGQTQTHPYTTSYHLSVEDHTMLKSSLLSPLKTVTLCSTLAFSSFFGESLCATDQPSLRSAYQQHFKIGSACRGGHGTKPKEWQLLKREFASLTAENCGKWTGLQRKKGVFTFAAMDRIVEKAELNDQEVIGHVLVWGDQNPGWLFKGENGKGSASRELLLKRMREHITTVLQHYKGKIKSWDVVNESILDNGQYRKNKWFEIIGPDYIQKAFEIAYEVDPSLHLIYNDYNMFKPAKVKAVVKMVKGLLGKGVAIHGIGLQGHWGMNYPSQNDLKNALDAFSATGLKLHISELDVSVLPTVYDGANINVKNQYRKELDPYVDGAPKDVLAKQAARYREWFQLFLQYPNLIRVTFWGHNDGMSWKNEFPIRGRTDYPLIFDRQLQPKPVHKALIDLVTKP